MSTSTTREAADISFNRACSMLHVSAREMAALRDCGLVPLVRSTGRQAFPAANVELARHLVRIGGKQAWELPTLLWYADLLFARSIGSLLINSGDVEVQTGRTTFSDAWPGDPNNVQSATTALTGEAESLNSSLAVLLDSLLMATLGPGQRWENASALQATPLYPLITYLRDSGQPLPSLASSQAAPASADSAQAFALLVLGFATLGLPLSPDLREIVEASYLQLRGAPVADVTSEERIRIQREQMVAVDKLYASKAQEIHTPLSGYSIDAGVIVAPKRTIALQMKLPVAASESALDNILDIIRPYLGPFGARVVQALYEIANDPPYWRNPAIVIDTNELLDRLGEKRDSRGIHYSRNRARLRDTLNAAHNLEIVGEYTAVEDGQTVRKAARRSVLSVVGATFDANETSDISTEDLFRRGLPKNMQVVLNFYEGVRRPDGHLGDQYVLVPRLTDPRGLSESRQLPKANYAGTHERLKHFLLYQYRNSDPRSIRITITRRAALESAGVTNKNVTRATFTLEKALKALMQEGTLNSYTPVPVKPEDTFVCVLSADVAARSLPSH